MSETNHARRFGVIWLVATLVATPLVIVLLGPILPPGNGSEQASGQVTDNTVLLAMATPVLLLVVIYLDLRGDLLPPAQGAASSKGRPYGGMRGYRRPGSS